MVEHSNEYSEKKFLSTSKRILSVENSHPPHTRLSNIWAPLPIRFRPRRFDPIAGQFRYRAVPLGFLLRQRARNFRLDRPKDYSRNIFYTISQRVRHGEHCVLLSVLISISAIHLREMTK